MSTGHGLGHSWDSGFQQTMAAPGLKHRIHLTILFSERQELTVILLKSDRPILLIWGKIENINDISKYEFYGGKDARGNSIWTKNFKEIKPLLEWNNNMGCVTVTYNAPLKRYLMCVTDGGNTVSKMNTYILEADRLDGNWKIITYMKEFGEQGYFVNIPSKFISDDGKQMWLLYSGNFAPDWNGQKIVENPPGSHYGMVFQKVHLVKQNSGHK